MPNEDGQSNDSAEPWRWSGPACVASSIGFLIGSLGALEALWPPLSALLPIGLFCWVPTAVIALRARYWWWVGISLAFIGAPLYLFAGVAVACSRGDCL